jgi:hypothetical protein
MEKNIKELEELDTDKGPIHHLDLKGYQIPKIEKLRTLSSEAEESDSLTGDEEEDSD